MEPLTELGLLVLPVAERKHWEFLYKPRDYLEIRGFVSGMGFVLYIQHIGGFYVFNLDVPNGMRDGALSIMSAIQAARYIETTDWTRGRK